MSEQTEIPLLVQDYFTIKSDGMGRVRYRIGMETSHPLSLAVIKEHTLGHTYHVKYVAMGPRSFDIYEIKSLHDVEEVEYTESNSNSTEDQKDEDKAQPQGID